MKTTLLTTTLLVALAPVTLGWRLRIYDREAYVSEILDITGDQSQGCRNLGANVNRAQSIRWDSNGPGETECEVILYDGACVGTPVGRSRRSDWNVPAFFPCAANKVNSYRIIC